MSGARGSRARAKLVLSALLLVLAALAWRAWRGEPGASGARPAPDAASAEGERQAQLAAPGVGDVARTDRPRRAELGEAPERGISLLVHDADSGEPIAGASVVATDAARTAILRGRTAEDGSLELPEADGGRWRVECGAEGYYTESVELPADLGVARTVELRPSVPILVRLIAPDGRPVAQAYPSEDYRIGSGKRIRLVATAEPPPPFLARTDRIAPRDSGVAYVRTSPGEESGGESADPLPPGAALIWLDVPPPVHVSAALRDVVLETKLALEGTRELTFVIRRALFEQGLARVVVRIVDAATAQPIAGARVVLNARDSVTAGAATVTTGVDGLATLDGEFSGHRELVVDAHGYARSGRHVFLEAGSERDLGDFDLRRPLDFSGRVVDERGEPVGAALVFLNDDRRVAGQPTEGVPARSSDPADGSFSVRGLEPARYAVFPVPGPRSTWACNPIEVDLRGGAPAELLVTLRRGTPLVLRNFGDERRVEVVDSGARVVWCDWVGRLRESWVPLVPDSYDVRVFDGEALAEQHAVAVGDESQSVSF